MTGPLDHDGNVTAWRLEQLEDEVRTLVAALQSATSTLGAQITALSNQIGQGLANLPVNYAPRPEADERHKAINARFEALDRLLVERQRAIEDQFSEIDKRLTERRENVDNRVKSNAERIERLERGAWAIATGILLSLAGAVLAFLKANGGAP